MVEEPRHESEARTAGLLLRAARAQAGLGLEQVAERLHLLPAVVSALEADDYACIRNATFVRGYLRNYSRLLGLDAEEVLRCHAARQAPPPRSEPGLARRIERWDGPRGAGRAGVVLALLAGSVMFLFHQREPVAQVLEPDADEITVETARGLHVVPLAEPAAGTPREREGG